MCDPVPYIFPLHSVTSLTSFVPINSLPTLTFSFSCLILFYLFLYLSPSTILRSLSSILSSLSLPSYFSCLSHHRSLVIVHSSSLYYKNFLHRVLFVSIPITSSFFGTWLTWLTRQKKRHCWLGMIRQWGPRVFGGVFECIEGLSGVRGGGHQKGVWGRR